MTEVDESKQLEGRMNLEAVRQEISSVNKEKGGPEEAPSRQISEDFEAESRERQAELEKEETVNEVRSLGEEGRSFGRPSIIKYLVVFFAFAVPNDIIDPALELTVILEILAWILSIFLSICSILTFWFFDHEQKRARAYLKKVEATREKIYRSARLALRIGKLFRNTKTAGKILANPTFKLVAGAVAEMIPFISMFPWSSISVILAYMDERAAYKEAGKTSDDLSQLSEDIARAA